MTDSARTILAAFDALPPADQLDVAAEIVRRVAPAGLFPDKVLAEIADVLFRSYDAEEAECSTGAEDSKGRREGRSHDRTYPR